MKIITRVLLVFMVMTLAAIGFSQTSPVKQEKKTAQAVKTDTPTPESEKAGSSNAGLRKVVEHRASWDIDVNIDEQKLEATIEEAVERALRSVEVAMNELERLEIHIEPIEVNIADLNFDMSPIVIDISDLDIDIEPIEIEDLDIDIDIDDVEIEDIDIDIDEDFNFDLDDDDDEEDDTYRKQGLKKLTGDQDKEKEKEKLKYKSDKPEKDKEGKDKEEKKMNDKSKGLKKLN